MSKVLHRSSPGAEMNMKLTFSFLPNRINTFSQSLIKNEEAK